jgi:hypothetical protein
MIEDELSHLDIVYGCRELERHITLGAYLGWQDKKWHLFDKGGNSLTEGSDSIFKLIQQLEKL